MVTQMLAAFGVTGIKETPGNDVARKLQLIVSPDPVVQQTTFKYMLPTNGEVTLQVYNRAGQHVTTLVDEYKTAGTHIATWNVQDGVANGVYFARLECAGSVGTTSFVVVR
jgi:hypothetical protein